MCRPVSRVSPRRGRQGPGLHDAAVGGDDLLRLSAADCLPGSEGRSWRTCPRSSRRGRGRGGREPNRGRAVAHGPCTGKRARRLVPCVGRKEGGEPPGLEWSPPRRDPGRNRRECLRRFPRRGNWSGLSGAAAQSGQPIRDMRGLVDDQQSIFGCSEPYPDVTVSWSERLLCGHDL